MDRRFVIIGAVSFIVLVFLSVVFVPHSKKAKPKPKGNYKLILSQAEKKEKSGDLISARALYKKAFLNITNSEELDKVNSKIEDLNIKILFSPLLDENSKEYIIKPGDSLSKIARKFHTTVELLKKSNRLKSDTIRAGRKLKVPKCGFYIIVDKTQNRLFLKKGDEIFKSYIVSTGENNSTPAGEFKIVNRLRNPVWYNKNIGAVIPPSSPKNYLGSRWLGLSIKGYGIHGTTEPDNLGKQVTKGCIRMRNRDVEELFDIVPIGTKVVIVE